MVTISILTKTTKKHLDELNGLMDQLRSYQKKKEHSSLSDLNNMIGNKSSTLVVAKDGDRIIGTAVLSVAERIGRRVGHVDDVIVSEEYRGQGLGEKIMRKVVTIARTKKLTSLKLTSRPSRVAAHRLYEKLGFEKKETEVFGLKL